jgi:hypothetical protein
MRMLGATPFIPLIFFAPLLLFKRILELAGLKHEKWENYPKFKSRIFLRKGKSW